MKKNLGFFCLLLTAMLFGSFGVWIKLLNQNIEINQQMVLRNFVAFAFSLLFIIVTKKYKLLKKGFWKNSKLLANIILVSFSAILYNFAMIYTKIAVVTFVFYIGNLLTSWLIGTLIYHEKTDLLKKISIFLVMLGLILFTTPLSVASLNIGIVLALASGILDALNNGLRKELSNKISKIVMLMLISVGSIVISSFLMLIEGQNFQFIQTMPLQSWVITVIFGCLLLAVGYLLFLGFQNFDLGLGTIVLSSELMFALIFGFLVFNEIPTTRELIGGFCILVASILPNLEQFFAQKHTNLKI